MKSDDNELFLRKLAEYYGYEFKVIDLNKFHTYEKVLRHDKRERYKSSDYACKELNFVPAFIKNNAVVICSRRSASKHDAICDLKKAYERRYSYNALDFNYLKSATYHMMENDWLNASSASEVEMHTALRKG